MLTITDHNDLAKYGYIYMEMEEMVNSYHGVGP